LSAPADAAVVMLRAGPVSTHALTICLSDFNKIVALFPVKKFANIARKSKVKHPEIHVTNQKTCRSESKHEKKPSNYKIDFLKSSFIEIEKSGYQVVKISKL